MKKIKLFFLALTTSAFCIFSTLNASFASEGTVSPNSSPQGSTASETGQEAPGIPEGLSESGTGIYENAGALWQSWMASRQPDESPYPDYICGAWSTDGTLANLTFAVTKDEAGEAGKQEILDLVADDSTVSFTYQSYPHHELWAIQLTLRERLGDETGAFGIGIYEDENRIHIDINSSNENSEAFMQECFQKYEDRICFEVGDGYTDQSSIEEYASYFDLGKSGTFILESPVHTNPGTSRNILPWIWASCIGILFLFAAILLRTRFLAVLQTTKGSTTAPSPVTKKQAIEAIKKNTAEPNPGAFQAIIEKLDEE